MRVWHCLVVASICGITSSASAMWPFYVCQPPHTQERAGNPQCLSKCAAPGRTCKYALGYVGGGCLGGRGECRTVCDGTFGWDYAGCWIKKPARVFLNFCHCKKCQPKEGSYEVDGPHVPDVFALRPVKRHCEKTKSCDHE